MAGSYKYVVGIDLGTTNTLACFFRNGRKELVKFTLVIKHSTEAQPTRATWFVRPKNISETTIKNLGT